MSPNSDATSTASDTPDNLPSLGLFTQIGRVSRSIELIPVILFILYFIGFVLLNVHLSKFSIIETNILSLNYVKSGVVFIIFNLLIIGAAWKMAREHSIDRKLPNSAIYLCITLLYCFIFFLYRISSRILIDAVFERREKALIISLLLYNVGILGYSYYCLNTKSNNKIRFLIACLLLDIIFFCIKTPELIVLCTYMITSGIIFYILVQQLYYNKGFHIDNITLSLPTLGFALTLVVILFSIFIYNNIPQFLGGGKAYKAVLYLTRTESDLLRDCCVLNHNNNSPKPVTVVYSSEKGFYIDNNDKVVIIPLEAVTGIKVRRCTDYLPPIIQAIL